MAGERREGRKLLVASIGVAAVSYVACGASTIGSTSNQGHGAGGSSDAGENMGIGGNILVSNLVAPCLDIDSTRQRAADSVPLELTNVEYDRTVRDLLGDTSNPSQDFPGEDVETGFKRVLAGDPVRLTHYVKAAGDIADAALGRLGTILPCDPATVNEDACAMQFIATFGKRAYRRPLTADDRSSLQQAYADARASGDFASGVRAVIFAALSSPHFYQIEERGAPSETAVLLGPYAIASRLSYFLYRSMPDAELFAAADAGALSTPENIAAQAQRMLQSPRAHEAVTDFFKEWLHLDRLSDIEKGADVLPNFAAVRDSMVIETTKFAESVFFSDGLYKSLLTSTLTWANADIAAIYGQPLSGPDFQQIKLDGTIRAGILTQPSILSMTSGSEQTSPSRRGAFVQEVLLCQTVPPPFPGHPTADVVEPGTSTRLRYQRATANPACSACHNLVDPIGFGLEGFDAVGRYRTMDNGQLIDTTGQFDIEGEPIGFGGAVDLANGLANSERAQTCLKTRWYRFALARVETECALNSLLGGDKKMSDLLVTIATSDAFRYARW